MMERSEIEEIAQRNLPHEWLFIVDVNVRPGNEIEVLVDSDTSVSVEDCVAINRAMEAELDRETEDFSLTVSSAGIGQPLKLLRQYKKLIGSPVEVLLRDGTKILAHLTRADESGITLSYTEKRAVEGKKRKEDFTVTQTYSFDEIKTTKEYLDFK